MNDLLTPTIRPLASNHITARATPRPPQAAAGFEVYWARLASEVREAQRLRYRVFAGEMGANLPSRTPGVDHDIYDPYCQHLVVRDAGELARPRHQAGIARVDAVDVGVDLAHVRAERRRDGHGRRIRSASPERGDPAIVRDPLKPGDDHDLAGRIYEER